MSVGGYTLSTATQYPLYALLNGASDPMIATLDTEPPPSTLPSGYSVWADSPLEVIFVDAPATQMIARVGQVTVTANFRTDVVITAPTQMTASVGQVYISAIGSGSYLVAAPAMTASIGQVTVALGSANAVVITAPAAMTASVGQVVVPNNAAFVTMQEMVASVGQVTVAIGSARFVEVFSPGDMTLSVGTVEAIALTPNVTVLVSMPEMVAEVGSRTLIVGDGIIQPPPNAGTTGLMFHGAGWMGQG